MRKPLYAIQELPAHLEAENCVSKPSKPSLSLKKSLFFMFKHFVYGWMFLAVRSKQLEKKLTPYLWFTWRRVFRNKKLAFLFYITVSAAIEFVVAWRLSQQVEE